jgi:hypothetical protein
VLGGIIISVPQNVLVDTGFPSTYVVLIHDAPSLLHAESSRQHPYVILGAAGPQHLNPAGQQLQTLVGPSFNIRQLQQTLPSAAHRFEQFPPESKLQLLVGKLPRQ